MPSPNRESSKIAYTRWEPLEASTPEDVEATSNHNNNNAGDVLPFHHFEQEESQQQESKKRRLSPRILPEPRPRPLRPHQIKCWEWGIRVLGILIIAGVSWILGFMTRWGVHHYYIDSRGHCVTPVPYYYDSETTEMIMEEINQNSIRQFFDEFINVQNHKIGSVESANFARNISELWKDFGIDNVDVHHVEKVRVPRPNSKMPSGITISDANGKILSNLKMSYDEDLVIYSPNAISEGRLVYGNFGRYQDFTNLNRHYGIDFNNSVVIIKVNQKFHTGSMVRNAQMMGAKAVILFPDPFPYILSGDQDNVGKLPSNVSLNTNVKFVPGDPKSPYFDENWTVPKIPVIGINYDQAKELLLNFTNAKGIDPSYVHGLPLNTTVERNFTAKVEVYREHEEVTLNNVIGTIRGRYEPTRYIIIGSHHDSMNQGASRPGIGHSVLMELVRVIGYEKLHGWQPGRSIIFASWDGEEFGHLGSTAWMFAHAKELSSRAVTYVDLDHLLQGDDTFKITHSPLLKQVIMEAALSVDCPSNPREMENAQQEDQRCTLFSYWSQSTEKDAWLMKTVDGSPFQSILGISTLELTMKNNFHGEVYPFSNSHYDTQSQVDLFLDLSQADAMAKFMVVLILKMVMSPKLPLSALDYGTDVEQGINNFMEKYNAILHQHKVDITGIRQAASKFSQVAKTFNSTFDLTVPSLQLLGLHEYNDQMLELERAFLLPPSAESQFFVTSEAVMTSTYRHVIHGPSPLNENSIEFLPRLRAALEIAKTYEGSIQENDIAWNIVKREAFYVVDALESASCVLENHLVTNHQKTV